MEPVKIKLLKVETKPDAEYPQEGKYPSGTVVREGEMYRQPIKGEKFTVVGNPLGRSLRTSIVKRIVTSQPDHIIFETENSIYKIIVEKDLAEPKI